MDNGSLHPPFFRRYTLEALYFEIKGRVAQGPEEKNQHPAMPERSMPIAKVGQFRSAGRNPHATGERSRKARNKPGGPGIRQHGLARVTER